MRRMVKSLIPAALLLALATLAARAGELAVQLRGPGLAESAGFVLAQARGYYAQEGLAVTLHPAQPAPPFESLARGETDLAVAWMPTALVARENGLPLVHIAQILARPALRLTCRRDAGVAQAADLRGKTIASWFGGAEYPLQAWLNRLDLPADDSLSGVALLAQWAAGAEMLRHKQAACISTLSHDPVAGHGLVELDPQDQGAAVLEDGLYVLSGALAAPGAETRLAGFLRASMKGWHEAVAHPEETARLILGPDPDQDAVQRQAALLRRMAGLLSQSGALDPDDYHRTVQALRAGGDRAVLRRDPQRATTSAISDRAAVAAPAAAAADALPPR
ncbi:ABC transporter substrate-binding protein [Paracoccus thiocyanatus]|uniref:Thiamine pyrimidine synthase n=1 Tax=Paracoccus thiocyanatus TaxID=34006 RepID=A0A3D8PDB5_9RHOB|nr:ABC transporter substrate-binding protein [Paracoccus thiocyanatus]RDW13437.1 nitrate ABC transporter substrate-binding protein [Paracoccus thiocyanatus]